MEQKTFLTLNILKWFILNIRPAVSKLVVIKMNYGSEDIWDCANLSE